ncbi:MAG: hypothetical protein R3Y11_06010 [Pseudomonadota bacterium]
MDQKISWYKEILELEPSSKIFFPLARLLSRDGYTSHAIDVLQHGLQHHKDFFEARLMLIALLHGADHIDARDAEVRTLLAYFADYPQFWDAWGDCLAHDGAQNDVSLAMRFIAASQQNDDISFASIFHKGLQSLGNNHEQKADVKSLSKPSDVIEAAEFVDKTAKVQDATPFSSHFFGEPMQVIDFADFVLREQVACVDHHTDDKDRQNQDPRFAQNSHFTYDSNDEIDHDVAIVLANENQDDIDFDYVAGFDSTEQNEMDVSSDEDRDFSDEIESLQSISLYNESKIIEQDSYHELCTLRTRSMADVLVSQGDIQSALAIYDELLLTEKSEAVRDEIQDRIDALRTSKHCFDFHDAGEVPCHGKEKLLQMLTLLAERLDSRAQ